MTADRNNDCFYTIKINDLENRTISDKVLLWGLSKKVMGKISETINTCF